MDLPNFDLALFLTLLFKLLLAFILALPIAWEREHATRIMGLRTFPLVAVASCGYVLVSITSVGQGDALARIIQGLITGIGFIGGGAILKDGGSVQGTATAASIWTMGILGSAVALDRYEIALTILLINYATLRYLTPLEKELGKPDRPPEEKMNS